MSINFTLLFQKIVEFTCFGDFCSRYYSALSSAMSKLRFKTIFYAMKYYSGSERFEFIKIKLFKINR